MTATTRAPRRDYITVSQHMTQAEAVAGAAVARERNARLGHGTRKVRVTTRLGWWVVQVGFERDSTPRHLRPYGR